MSFDWTSFFNESPSSIRTAYKTLFDAAPETPKKKPKPKPKPKSLFDAPPEEAPEAEAPPVTTAPVAPAPKPKPKKKPKKKPEVAPPSAAPGGEGLSIFDKHPDGMSGAPPKETAQDDLWEEFLEEVFGAVGGATLVPNSHTETKDKYPKVQVDTLVKTDKAYHDHLLKLFESWKSRDQQEGYWIAWGQSQQIAKSEALEKWPPTDPKEVDWEDPALQKVHEMAEGEMKGKKIGLIKWLRGEDPESPWQATQIMTPTGPSSHMLGLIEAKKLVESLYAWQHKFGEKKKKEELLKKFKGLMHPDTVDWEAKETKPLLDLLEEEFGSQSGILYKKLKVIKFLKSDESSPWKGSGLKETKLSVDRLFKMLLEQGVEPPQPELLGFPDLPHDVHEKASKALHDGMKGLVPTPQKLIQILGKVKLALGEHAENFDYVESTLKTILDKFLNSLQITENAGLDPSIVDTMKGRVDFVQKYLDKHIKEKEPEKEPDYTSPGIPEPLEIDWDSKGGKAIMDYLDSKVMLSKVPDYETNDVVSDLLYNSDSPWYGFGVDDVTKAVEGLQEHLKKKKPKGEKPKGPKPALGQKLHTLDQIEEGDVVFGTNMYGSPIYFKFTETEPGKYWGIIHDEDGTPVEFKAPVYLGPEDLIHGGYFPNGAAIAEMPTPKAKKKKKKVKKDPKVKIQAVSGPYQLAMGDVVTYKSGKKTFHGVVVETTLDGGVKLKRVSPTKGLVGWGKYYNPNSIGLKDIQVYTPEHIPKKYHHLPFVADRMSGKHQIPDKPPPPKPLPPPPPAPKVMTPKPLPKAKKGTPPAPPKGKPVLKGDYVKEGEHLMWESDGKTFVGTVSHTEGHPEMTKGLPPDSPRFYVTARDANTGKPMGSFVFDDHDLETVGVGKVEESEIPDTGKLPKIGPKPKPPKHKPQPQAPVVPPEPIQPQSKTIPPKIEGKQIHDDKGMKPGAHLTWTTSGGNKYIGRVEEKGPDGKWHVQVLNWNTGEPVSGKIRTFYVEDEKNKFTQRDTHQLTPKMVQGWEEKWKGDDGALGKWKEEHQKWDAERLKHHKVWKAKDDVWAAEVAKADQVHQKKVQKWKDDKAQLEGKKDAAIHPSKKETSKHLTFGEDADVKHDHRIVRHADALLPVYREKYKGFFETLAKSAEKKIDPHYSGGAGSEENKLKEIWNLRSDGEKLMIRSVKQLQQKFQQEVLKPDEREALAQALGAWKGDPAQHKSKQLMHLTDQFLPHTKSKATEIHDEGEARDLSIALAKALAWNQAVFDAFGIDSMLQFRGSRAWKDPSDHSQGTWMDDLEQGDLVPEDMPYRSLSGFSTSPSQAAGWNKNLTAIRVPASQVFLSPVTSSNMNSEDEWIVASPGSLPWKFVSRKKEYKSFDQDKMKLGSLFQLAKVSDEFREGLRYHLQGMLG